MIRRLWRVCIRRRGGRLVIGRLVNGRRHGGRHDRRMCCGSRARRGHRVGSLAAITAMRKLVIMEATSQLGLLQVRGNVLVRHFLEPGLKKIYFLSLRD